MGKEITREHRQKQLEEYLRGNPLATDEHLAHFFHVSVPTIRLDRMSLGIPEMRERLKAVANHTQMEVRSLARSELVGELLDLELGRTGLSSLTILPEMVLSRTKVARGHFLFAQANSLAVALIDSETVLTGSARVRYKRPVFLGERVLAKAVVKVKKGNTYLISVYSKVEKEMVFKGQFIVSDLAKRSSGGHD
ncbi:MAG: transcription factor FapR [Bacillota bacterium]